MKVRKNSDEDFVEQMRKAIRDNNGYCPCRKEKTEETKCMCKEFLEQGLGFCHCGLYEKTEI